MTELLSDSDVRRIAHATAEEIARRNSFMMTQKDIAAFFGYSQTSSTLRKILALPDFPMSSQIVGEGRPRWVRSEVEAWARSRFAERGMDVLATIR